MVNFDPRAAEIGSLVWGTPPNFNWFRVASWQRYCTAYSTGCQPNFAALNRRRHLCSAGRPSLGHWPAFLVYFKQIGKMGYTNYKTNENDFSSVMQ